MVHMYKLLIADDEKIVLDSITFIIERNFIDVVVVGTARSGREAIEKAETLKPDIIFMDIRMPGINGMEAIREIRARQNNVMFVILTACDQFDFAKEAVKLEVSEYLLKPVNREKIVKTIKKSIEIISSNREKWKRELALKERLESVLPILENSFIYSMLFFKDHSMELDSYRDIFELDEEGGYIITVKFGETRKGISAGNRIVLNISGQTFYPYFRDIFKGKCKCLIGPLMMNRIFVFVPVSAKEDETAMKLESVGIAEYVYNSLAEKVGVDIFIGIGRVYCTMKNIFRSYEESLKAVNFLTGSGFMHIMDVPAETGPLSEYPQAKEKLLLDKAASGDTEACIQAFNQIYDWLFREYALSFRTIKVKLLELMVLIHRLGYNYRLENEEHFNPYDYVEELLCIENPVELKVWCRERIEHITRRISGMRETRVNSSLILKAMKYIKDNYRNEITLEDISREVNISSHYFSKLFKDEVGENFIDYVTSMRIQKSKELLVKNQLSVKEICFEIGYGDPNYFSRIFKKVVGISPTEYKELTQIEA